MFKKLKEIGPGAMVAAAFIGPGTVTTATVAGAGFGYTLLWAVLFSVIATVVLQEMAARLGIIGRMGLGEAIRQKFGGTMMKWPAFGLVLGAILIGNAAYETGNITGAVLGFNRKAAGLPGLPFNPLILLVVLSAFFLLFSGKYKLIERSLVLMVSLMGLVFLATAILLKPDYGQILQGIFLPTLPDKSLLMVMGLIGTTVVPYNLFLHASAVKKRWEDPKDLPSARWDTIISVLLGGVITMAIVVTSAVAFHGSGVTLGSGTDLAVQLEPLMGDWAKVFVALGFLSAGLTSTITAPLAAAFATAGVLGWEADLKGKKFQLVWGAVLLTGFTFSMAGFKPISVILFAQIANGLLLPIIAGFLLWIMNDRKIVGSYTNTKWVNLLGAAVVLVALMLGVKGILSATNIL